MSWRDTIKKADGPPSKSWRDTITKPTGEQKAIEPLPQDNGFLEKLRGIPAGLADTAASAADYVGKSVTGQIPLAEQAERLGTAARGAGDVIQSIGDLPSKAIASLIPGLDYEGAGAKPSAKLLERTGLADAKSLEAKDAKYPGARALGEAIPQMALGGGSFAANVGVGAVGSAGGQLANKGSIDAGDLVFDSALSGAVPAAFKGAGMVAKKAAPLAVRGAKATGVQTARVLTGLPSETIETYAQENRLARAMPKNALEGVAADTTQAVGKVAERATKGSGEAFDILAREGVEVPRADVLRSLEDQKAWLERTGDYGSTRSSDLKSLQNFIDKVAGESGEFMPGARAKGLVQQIDEDLPVLQKKAGDKVTQGQAAIAGGRSNVDEMLKGQSPAYRAQMAKVAADTDLAKRVNANFGDQQQALNNLKGIARGNTPFREQTLDDLSNAMGDDFTKRAKVAMAKDAFTQRSVNGSRNVNFLSNIPYIGPVLGYAADYISRPATAKAIDLGVAMSEGLAKAKLSPGVKRALQSAAVRGPQALLAAHQMLMKNDVEYRKANEGTAP